VGENHDAARAGAVRLGRGMMKSDIYVNVNPGGTRTIPARARANATSDLP